MKFGDNLRKLRKLKKLSQEDLAEKVNVSRQSVSKWETGDAYPEMNNILELCKIFHCRINDLVNDSILDVDSLDDEIKMNVIKLKKEQQEKMKGLSKAIFVISRIIKIICIVCIPIILITMIISGLIFSKLSIEDNTIKYKDIKVNIKEENGNSNISLIVKDEKLTEIEERYEIELIKNILENNSKVDLILYVEIGFIILIIFLVIISIMLNSLEKLFININKGDTPFTLENVKYIKKIAFLMIIATLLPSLSGTVFEMLIGIDFDNGFELFNLIEILFLFSIAYIFEYGYEIQLDSKGKMYGDEDE